MTIKSSKGSQDLYDVSVSSGIPTSNSKSPTMKRLTGAFLSLLLLSSAAIAQSTTDEAFPSFGEIFGSIASGTGGMEASLTDTIDRVVSTMTEQETTENTLESVQTAIEGPLVVEGEIPEINREIAEAIDSRTNRYAPRLKLDFESFPLVRSTSGKGPTSAERIAKHLQIRLRLDQPISIDIRDRRAHLQGTVPTERHKELATIILRFEPGVDAVKNELDVKKTR